MIFDKHYCIMRSEYHETEAANAKRDAETALTDPVKALKDEHHDMFMKLYEEHTRYAKAWHEAVEDAPE